MTNGDKLGGLEFAGFVGRKRKPEQSDRLEPAFAETDFSDSVVLSAFCTKNGAGRSGDISGDKLGGLSGRRPKPWRAAVLRARSSAGCRAALGPRNSGTGPLVRFFDRKASGDKAVTSGDKLGGLEFAGFSGQKTEFRARRTSQPVFGGNRANLEAQAAHLTPDTKKRTFRSWLFSALFAPKTER